MPNRLIRPPAPRRRPIRVLVALALAVAVLAAGCSDAHSQAQRDWVDTGIDPNVLTILAPAPLVPVLTALNQAYLAVRPGTSMVFVNQITDPAGKRNTKVSNLTNLQTIQQGAAPSLWVDLAASLKPFAKDPRAQGPPVPFAVEPVELVVKAGNPAKVTGLDAFAAGGPTTGRCSTRETCGKLAYQWLAAAKIKPAFDATALDAPQLLKDIVAGKVDAGLVMGLDLKPGDATVATVPVPSPPSPVVTYRSLVMSPNPTATAFAKWVSSSPAAAAVFAAYGLRQGSGRSAT